MRAFRPIQKREVAQNRGVGLVEVIIGIAVVTASLSALTGAFMFYAARGLDAGETIQAAYLLEEGIEAARYLRDSDFVAFSALDPDTTYYIATTTAGYEATTTPTMLPSGFTRTLQIESVYRRDTDDDLVEATDPAAKTLDPNTRRAVVVISWQGNSASSTTYLTNLFDE
jgi:hypothetical protein